LVIGNSVKDLRSLLKKSGRGAVPRTAAYALVGSLYDCFGEPNQEFGADRGVRPTA
jgi:hypothetical protein